MWGLSRHEIGKVGLPLAMQAVMAIGFMVGLTALNALLVKRLGIQYLPYSYIVLSLFNIIGTFGYLLVEARMGRIRLLMILAGLSGGILLLARSFIQNEPVSEQVFEWNLLYFFLLAYLVQGFCASALNAQMWSMINELFRPAQGRKLYPYFSIAWLLGGVVGGLLIHLLVPLIGVAGLITVWAASFFCIIPLSWLLQWISGREMRWKPEAGHIAKEFSGRFSDLKETYQFIKKSSIAHYVMAITLFCFVVSSVQDFQYTQVMNLTFETEASLTTFYGTYNIFWNVSAIFLQMFVAEKLLLQTGIFRGFMIVPLTALTAFCLLIAQFDFWEGVWLRYSWNVVMTMIYFNAYQLIFNVFPLDIRGRMRGVYGGFVNAIGAIMGGLLLILFSQKASFLPAKWQYILPSVLGLACCLGWLYTVWKGRRVYIQTLIGNLHQKNHDRMLEALESMEERREPAIIKALTDMLLEGGEYNLEIKEKVMEVLSRLSHKDAVRTLSLFLHNPDAHLRVNAISALASFDNLVKYPFAFEYVKDQITGLFSKDASGRVRVQAGKFILKFFPKEDLPRFIFELLNHPDRDIRMMTMQTIDQLNIPLIDIMVISRLKDRDQQVKMEAVRVLWKYADYKKHTEKVIDQFINSTDIHEQQNGLTLLIRLGPPHAYLEKAEKFLESPDFLVRSLACLICLSLLPPNSEKGVEALDRLVKTLSDPGFDAVNRKQFVSLLPILKDEILDALLEAVQQLPAEQRQVAAQGLENIAGLLYEDLI